MPKRSVSVDWALAAMAVMVRNAVAVARESFRFMTVPVGDGGAVVRGLVDVKSSMDYYYYCGLVVEILFFCGLFFAGIRGLVFVLHALPLCGAALTFFAAAKKVSKESGLTPPALLFACGTPTGLTLQTATHYLLPVASALEVRLTRFNHPQRRMRQQMVTAAQVANCV